MTQTSASRQVSEIERDDPELTLRDTYLEVVLLSFQIMALKFRVRCIDLYAIYEATMKVYKILFFKKRDSTSSKK